MSRAIRTFQNVQARVCRALDGAWHEAWTAHLGQSGARVRLERPVAFEMGERVAVECYGDGMRVRFAGSVVGQAGELLAMTVAGAMTFEPSRTAVRFRVARMDGGLHDALNEVRLEVRDVSHESLGGVADRPCAPGGTMRLRVETPVGSFEAEVLVVNCVPNDRGGARVGLRIIECSRLDAALWQRLLEECAEEGEGLRAA